MSKRLQVILRDPEYRQVQKAARSRHMSVARRREPESASGKKLAAVRAAARFDFPTGDIDRMLAEIEVGYGAVGRS
jgi:hypothetical protein